MNFIKKLISRRVLSVLDFGAQTVTVLCVEKRDDGSVRVLGGGEAPSRGVGPEGIVLLGDAVESVVDAVAKAQRSAGVRIDTLYFNLEDILLQGSASCGSACLVGEGEINSRAVNEARQMAERRVANFYERIVYAVDTGYLIDQKDPVENPVGVFGQQLDVSVYFLLARAELCDAWKKIMERAGLAKSVPVVSAWSTAYGVLPKGDRRRRRVIVDFGDDLTTTLVFKNGGIQGLRIRATAADRSEAGKNLAADVKELMASPEATEQILVAGDRASDEEALKRIKENFSAPVFVAAAVGIPKFDQPRLASLVGLVGVAEELEKKAPLLRREKGLLGDVKEKAMEFVQEYF